MRLATYLEHRALTLGGLAVETYEALQPITWCRNSRIGWDAQRDRNG